MISREYGWLARQRYAAVTRPVGMDAGQRTQPFRGAAVPRRVRVRWNPGVRQTKTKMAAPVKRFIFFVFVPRWSF